MKNLILGLDVSTTTIGIALFEDLGDKGKLKLLTHVSPKVKPKPENKMQELFEKVRVFESEFLIDKLKEFEKIGKITKVIIEEPLLQSNNVYTVGTLLRFNGIIARSVYEILGVVPDFISSYDARKFGFPELMGVRTHDKKGKPYTEAAIKKKKPVLFGNHPWDVNKKMVIWELVADMEPQIPWMYTRNNTLKAHNFDMTDSYVAVLAYMQKECGWVVGASGSNPPMGKHLI